MTGAQYIISLSVSNIFVGVKYFMIQQDVVPVSAPAGIKSVNIVNADTFYLSCPGLLGGN